MNVGATAEQPHLMRRLSRGLGNTKLGTSQEDNDDDNDEDDVNNPMALMRKVSKLGTTQEDKQIRKAAYHTLVDAGAAEKPYRGVRKSHGDDGRPDGFPKEPLAFCPKRTAEELAAAP